MRVFLVRVYLLILMVVLPDLHVRAQTANTSSISIEMVPFPSTLRLGILYLGGSHFGSCYQFDDNARVLTPIPPLNPATPCGALNFSAVRTDNITFPNGTRQITSAAIYDVRIEAVVVDTLSYYDGSPRELSTNVTRVSELVNASSAWSSTVGPPPLHWGSAASWSTVRAAYEGRSFFGALNATNALPGKDFSTTRFYGTEGNLVNLPAPLATFGVQLLVYYPIWETVLAATPYELTDVHVEMQSMYVMALPFNASQRDLKHEHQVELLPRGSLVTNYSRSSLANASAANLTNTSNTHSPTTSVFDVTSRNESFLIEFRNVTERRFRTDLFFDHSRQDGAFADGSALLPLPDLFFISLADIGGSQAAAPLSAGANASVTDLANATHCAAVAPGGALLRPLASTDTTMISRSVTCFGLLYSTIRGNVSWYGQMPSAAMTLPTNRCYTVGTHTASGPLTSSVVPSNITVCRSEATLLVSNFYLCWMTVRQNSTSGPRAPALGFALLNFSTNATVVDAQFSARQNSPLLLSAAAARYLSERHSALEATSSALVDMLPLSALLSTFGANPSAGELTLKPQSCFSRAAVAVFNVCNTTNLASTLFPTGLLNFSLSHSLEALQTCWPLVSSFVAVSSLLLTSFPLDGYCGTKWATGLVATVQQTGMLVAYHQIPTSLQSGLYSTSTRTLNLTTTPADSRYLCCTHLNVASNASSESTGGASPQPSCLPGLFPSETAPANVEALRQVPVVSKRANVTITASALRCSFDVYGVRRNCTAASGAYLQLVLLPNDQADALLSNRTAMVLFMRENPVATALQALPLQLTDSFGIARFPAAAPENCLAGSLRVAAVFAPSGASDGTTSISDGAVVAYYDGIDTFASFSQLYVTIRPRPLSCAPGVRTRFVGGSIGVTLGVLDVDVSDSCGTLLSGQVSLALAKSSEARVSSAATVDLSQAPASHTLGGTLVTRTSANPLDPSNWRATFIDLMPTTAVVGGTRGIELTLLMGRNSLAAIGDLLLISDYVSVPYLVPYFLSNCSNFSASWVDSGNGTETANSLLLDAPCGVATVAAAVTDPPVEVVVDVDLNTDPPLVSTVDLNSQSVWINLTFSLNCFNTSAIVLPSDFAQYITFSSNLATTQAPRGFLFTASQSFVHFNPVVVREYLDNTSRPSHPGQWSLEYVIPILVLPNPLVNNYVAETVTVSIDPSLVRGALDSPTPRFRLSQTALSFTVYPNPRSKMAQAVTWITFLTMSGTVVRIGSLSALQYATSCSIDYTDQLDLTLHPLSFGIGSESSAYRYLVGAVVGNAAIVALLFLVHLVKDEMLFRTDATVRLAGLSFGDSPGALRGFSTFPNWAFRAMFYLLPGIMLGGVKSIALGLHTFLLYSMFLALAVFGIGYPIALTVVQRYYRPRWHPNEALLNKDVSNAVVSSSPSPKKRKTAAFLSKQRALSAVSGSKIVVRGLLSKSLIPVGSYDVNHPDHVRFQSTYQDYQGDSLTTAVVENSYCILFAVASAFNCPTNQLVGILFVGLHAVFVLMFRPYLTIARMLCNVLIDIGCLTAIVISLRGQESAGVVVFQSMLISASLLNFLGILWMVWRSESLRHLVRQKRKMCRREDKFLGKGLAFVSWKTSFLRRVENILYDLHSVKPEVVRRRELRRRKFLLEDDVELETSSGSPTDEEDEADMSVPGGSPTLAAIMAAATKPSSAEGSSTPGRGSFVLPPQQQRPIADQNRPLTPLNSQDPNVSFSRSLDSAAVGVASDNTRWRSDAASDDGSSDSGSPERRHKNVIHLDAPDALSETSARNRRFAANRFKAYIRTESGKPFGRSDEDSVVKRLIVTEDGVREVREWREGTVQMANEEVRRRERMEADLRKLTGSPGDWVRKPPRGGNLRHPAYNDDMAKNWEEAFLYEIAKKHGFDPIRAGSHGVVLRESLLERRRRVMGDREPRHFDFEKGEEVSSVQL